MIRDQRIPPGHFHEPAVLEAEQQSLFRHTWQFFCLASELQADNDFVTGSVGGIPLVVQNIRGELHCFHNVCSHRHSPIQVAPAGNRGLTCPYHGWGYDARGVPVGIPHNKEFFPVEPAQREALALRRFSVSACGQLVFVSIEPSAPLADQLGEWQPLLAAIGGTLDDVHFRSVVPSDCNWKYVVCNAFDDIHAQFVHPSASLDRSIYTGGRWISHAYDAATEVVAHNYSRRHAELNVYMTPETVQATEARWDPYMPGRAHAFDHYLHLFLYPNLIITSVQGYWYNIVRYRPVAPERSEMDYWLVPARPQGSGRRVTPDQFYLMARGAMRVFGEDVAATETAQQGVRTVARPGILGQRENKMADFEAAYLDSLKVASRVPEHAAGGGGR